MAQINKPTDYFDISTWTATTSAISNLSFSPDWVWIKSTDSANGHILFDTIRGANKRLSSASDGAESTRTDELMSFDSNGYTLGSSGNTNDTSPFNASYVGWSWKGSDSSAVSNTDGSITSTVSANTTAGFSIVSYTGTGSAGTIGHGLGGTPDFWMTKARSETRSWYGWHTGINLGQVVNFNSTNTASTDTSLFTSNAPTSTVYNVGTSVGTNNSGITFVTYLFRSIKGFSKFGSYTGNGSTDGTFIYTGFKPAWFMTKRTDIANSWVMFDNKRSSSGGFNEIDYSLNANSDSAQETSNTSSDVDFCSNGIKITEDNGAINESGGSYIYMAFAENPLVGTNNIPAVAR